MNWRKPEDAKEEGDLYICWCYSKLGAGKNDFDRYVCRLIHSYKKHNILSAREPSFLHRLGSYNRKFGLNLGSRLSGK